MASSKLCLALDVSSFSEAETIVNELHNCVDMFKVGKELFTQVGPRIIEHIQNKNSQIFLDLKFHDIPNTVRKACEVTAKLGVNLVNVHASGGCDMMKAALQGADDSGNKNIKVIAVTVLTSHSEQTLKNEMHVKDSLEEHVIHLAKLAQNSGLAGVVASPQEIKILRQTCGKNFLIVTPGVRPTWAEKNDQNRVMTPREAVSEGADILVVGRPILLSGDRRDSVKKIIKEMAI